MYNEFSSIYDKLVFDIDYENHSRIIKENVDFKENMNILEIGIGTGNMTKYFIGNSKEYFGLDPSVEMLEIASNKLIDYSNIRYLNIGIEELEIKDYFDFAFSTLDTINYLKDYETVKKSFENVYDSLKHGSYFSFDVNSLDKIENVLGDNSYVYEYENIFYTWQNEYDYENKEVDMILDFFVEEEGAYNRITEYQHQKYYSTEILKEMLKEIGFSNFKIKDFDTGKDIEEYTQRILITCQK
ncbi:class I SAM-dependent methyltransferase [Lagierella sp. ICN-221743]